MSPHLRPSSFDTGTAVTQDLTPAEIVTAIIPALIGMAAVALIAVLMLL